jgi:DNA-binding protein HU-beta
MSSIVRRREISYRVSTKLGGNKSQGESALAAVLESIQEALSKGEKIVLTGFGTFELRQVKERKVKSIAKDNKTIIIPAHKRVGFTPGSILKSSTR